MSNPYGFETRCVHGTPERAFEDGARSVSFPIYQTATFGHTFVGHGQFNYTRQDNPTRLHLEETVAALEEGVDCVAFASGMAAISAVMELFQPGDHVICGEDLYGGTTRLFNNVNIKNGLAIEYVDTTDVAKVRAAIRPETKAIYLETPTNPMMNVTDIRACAEVAKEAGALLIVDNTFLSPYFQNPLGLGADVVVHSGSKYLSGHNDTISGFVVVKDQALADRVRLLGKTTGGMLAPFDSWLVMRGVKTLALRMEKAQRNALQLARALKEHPRVAAVYYPGLPEHPGHELSGRQASGYGAMLSFRVDSRETAERVLLGVKLITFAETLGGTESLITYPLTQTHDMVAEDIRQHLGITDTLLRLSVGIEDADDLIADLKQALEG